MGDVNLCWWYKREGEEVGFGPLVFLIGFLYSGDYMQ